MAKFTFQTGDPAASAFSVPAGTYSLKVIDAIADISKAGNEQIKIKLRVIKPDGNEGPALFDYLGFSDSVKWKMDQFVAACGKHPGEGRAVELDTDEMVGWECEAELIEETYNGNKNNKVARYLVPEY